MTSPANASEIPSVAEDGSSAVDEPVGHERRRRPPTAASTPIASGSGQTSVDRASIALAPGPPAIENGIDAANRTSRTIDVNTLSSWAWPASGAPGAVARVGIASAATARTSRTAIVRTGAAPNALDAVPPAAEEERQPEDEQAVGQDRPDQRGLDDDDQAGLEREDRDEQLGQVAQRRLEDAGLARPEPMAELVGARADEPGQPGQGDRRHDEHERVGRAAERRRAVSDRSAPTATTSRIVRGPAERPGARGRRGRSRPR